MSTLILQFEPFTAVWKVAMASGQGDMSAGNAPTDMSARQGKRIIEGWCRRRPSVPVFVGSPLFNLAA